MVQAQLSLRVGAPNVELALHVILGDAAGLLSENLGIGFQVLPSSVVLLLLRVVNLRAE